MRTLKLLLLAILGLGLVVIGVANMAPVDVYLLPAAIDGGANVLRDVPLAAVILVAVVVGVFVGQIMEYMREAKYRRRASERRREVGELRREVGRLAARVGDRDDDLPELPSR